MNVPVNDPLAVQEEESQDELVDVLGRLRLPKPPTRAGLEGAIKLAGCVIQHEKNAVGVVEKPMATHNVRVDDPTVDFHFVFDLFRCWFG